MAKPYKGPIPSLFKSDSTSNPLPCIQLLKATWSSPNSKYQIGTLDRQSKIFRNIPVSSITEAAQLANKHSSECLDVYFAIAGYKTSDNRHANNASGASTYWLDIDCGNEKVKKNKGYQTVEAAVSALKNFCQTINCPPPTHIINSGGGLHGYWVLDGFTARDQWQAYAKRLKDLTHAHGLLADDSRTADIASVLRLPGTLNYKYDPPRPITVIHSLDKAISSDAFHKAIDAAHASLAALPSLAAEMVAKRFPSVHSVLGNGSSKSGENTVKFSRVRLLLQYLDPEEGGHDAWVRIGMAIHNEFGGSDEGLDCFDQWSSGGKTYPGRREIEKKWRSFSSNREDRCSIGTIINRISACGYDWTDICSKAEDPFEPCEYEVIEATQPPIQKAVSTAAQQKTWNPLDSFSLLGWSEEIARDTQDLKPILGGLAFLGQATVIFAPPNSGKTLLTLHNVCDEVRQGKIEGSDVYYVNVDDSGQGLADKLAIADEYRFHMLSEGYRGFKASNLLEIMAKMVTDNQAKGVIVILDTIKKFTNLMDKTKASQFTQIIRRFVLKGGTVIGMAHTNKKPGADGKPVYGGTSDLVDDFDCAYTIATEERSNPTEKIVVFDNIKRRGNNPLRVAYRYSIESVSSYHELLMSVERIDDEQRVKMTQLSREQSDAMTIASIMSCIGRGTNTKMLLAEEVSKEAGISKRQALAVIERYSGSDPGAHKWSFVVRERGAKVFTLLAPQQAKAD